MIWVLPIAATTFDLFLVWKAHWSLGLLLPLFLAIFGILWIWLGIDICLDGSFLRPLTWT
jgi:hypothetical protein